MLYQRLRRCWYSIKPTLGDHLHGFDRAAPLSFPANTRRQTNVDLMLAHRLRRWPNIKTTLFQRLVSAGLILYCTPVCAMCGDFSWLLDPCCHQTELEQLKSENLHECLSQTCSTYLTPRGKRFYYSPIK